MKIALVSPFEEPVPPRTYGGTELVVYNLAEELNALGHDVTVFASGDSACSARIDPIFEISLRADTNANDMRLRDALKLVGISRIVERANIEDYDIIHNHLSWRLLPFANLLRAPMVTTLHGPVNVCGYERIFNLFRDSAFISISDAQRRPAPDMNFVATVYNGIDCSAFHFNDSPGDCLVFLGRFSPEKGPLAAIKAAKAAGSRLIMAGKVDLVDETYFRAEIEPWIDGEQVTYIGEVNHAQKNELLGRARALLFPIDWEEPFGLVMVEALATGTPVIANRRGSVPEIITPEVGFVTDSFDSIVQALGRIDSISRKRCREYVCDRFDRSRMAQSYLAAYEKVIESGEPVEIISAEPDNVMLSNMEVQNN
jgi:glycosyltransferase involved in cell wall biosynthesis